MAKAAAPKRKRTRIRKVHKRKFLVIIDDSEECGRALRFASLRAEHTGGGVILLYVASPGDFHHWLNVDAIMREEAMREGRAALRRFAKEIASYSPIKPQQVIREGNLAEEIVKLIEKDKEIAILVLAAAKGNEGPGPLVSSLATKGTGAFPIPVTIVPGDLTDKEIDRLA